MTIPLQLNLSDRQHRLLRVCCEVAIVTSSSAARWKEKPGRTYGIAKGGMGWGAHFNHPTNLQHGWTTDGPTLPGEGIGDVIAEPAAVCAAPEEGFYLYRTTTRLLRPFMHCA